MSTPRQPEIRHDAEHDADRDLIEEMRIANNANPSVPPPADDHRAGDDDRTHDDGRVDDDSPRADRP